MSDKKTKKKVVTTKHPKHKHSRHSTPIDEGIEIAYTLKVDGKRWKYEKIHIQGDSVVKREEGQYNALPYTRSRIMQQIDLLARRLRKHA